MTAGLWAPQWASAWTTTWIRKSWEELRTLGDLEKEGLEVRLGSEGGAEEGSKELNMGSQGGRWEYCTGF